MNTNELQDVELLIPFSVSTKEDSEEQFTANITARIVPMPGITQQQLYELAAKPRIITFANSARAKGAKHLRALHNTTVDIVLTPINQRVPAVPTKDKAISTIVDEITSGKMTIEELQAEIERRKIAMLQK